MSNLYGDAINQIAQNMGVDVSALPDGLYSTVLKTIANASQGLVVITDENATINGYQVPKLTEDQIVTIYNAVVTGRNVVISDKDEKMHFVVNQADVVGDSVNICVIYFDIMHLCYSDDGTITFKGL